MSAGAAEEDLFSVGALGALDPVDRQRLAEVVLRDEKAAALFEALQRTADLLGHTAPTVNPPRQARAQLLEAVQRLEASRREIERGDAGRSITFDRLLPWVAVAMFAVMCAWMAFQMSRARGEIRSLRAALLEPGGWRSALLVPAGEKAPATTAEFRFSTQRQEGRLVVRELDKLPEGSCYQLWLFDADSGGAVSAGIFAVRPDGTAEVDFKPASPVGEVGKVAVSLERDGGVPVSEGPIVLAGQAY